MNTGLRLQLPWIHAVWNHPRSLVYQLKSTLEIKVSNSVYCCINGVFPQTMSQVCNEYHLSK